MAPMFDDDGLSKGTRVPTSPSASSAARSSRRKRQSSQMFQSMKSISTPLRPSIVVDLGLLEQDGGTTLGKVKQDRTVADDGLDEDDDEMPSALSSTVTGSTLGESSIPTDTPSSSSPSPTPDTNAASSATLSVSPTRKLKEKVDAEFDEHLRQQRRKRLNFLLTQAGTYSRWLAEQLDQRQKAQLKSDTSVRNGRGEEPASLDQELPKRGGRKRKGAEGDGAAGPSPANSTRAKRAKTDNTANLLDAASNENGGSLAVATPVVIRSSHRQPSLIKNCVMREYQLSGLDWLISLWEQGLNGILADEMGLGKTLQTIALLAHLHEQGVWGPFLIIAPVSTLTNWLSEIQRFAPSLNAILYHGTKQERANLREKKMRRLDAASFPIIITSYSIIMNDRPYLQRYSWKYIVIDEGHRLKNMNCKLMRELKFYSSANRLILSGTPLQNNLAELWSLLNFLMPDIFASLDDFESWFELGQLDDENASKLLGNESTTSIVSNLHEILKPFLLRRMKSEVVLDLPKKKEYLVFAPLSPKQKELYAASMSGFRSLRDFLLQKIGGNDQNSGEIEGNDDNEEVIEENEETVLGDVVSKKANLDDHDMESDKENKAMPADSTMAITFRKEKGAAFGGSEGGGLPALSGKDVTHTPQVSMAESLSQENETGVSEDTLEVRTNATPPRRSARLRKAARNGGGHRNSTFLESDDDLSDDEFLLRMESMVRSSPKKPTLTAAELKRNVALRHLNDQRLHNVIIQLRKICNHPYIFNIPDSDCEEDFDRHASFHETSSTSPSSKAKSNAVTPRTAGEPEYDPNTPIQLPDIVAASGKMLLLERMLPHLLRRRHKVLIFSQMTTMLDILADWFEFIKGWDFCRIDGNVSVEERRRQMDEFNNNPDGPKLFLLSTRSGGLGINLTASDTVILYDSDWNPQWDLQAQDRVHRIGQTKPVIVYRLVSSNSIEKRIVDRANSKRRLEKLVIHHSEFKGSSRYYKSTGRKANLNELATLLFEEEKEAFDAAPAGSTLVSDDDDGDGEKDSKGEKSTKKAARKRSTGESKKREPGRMVRMADVISDRDLERLLDRSPAVFEKRADSGGVGGSGSGSAASEGAFEEVEDVVADEDCNE
ncbi:SNF2 family N-terminal domain-containing protein [Zopfochytrium polystomum]|nr:SNF2 family N-terminal domain-containing protein [Zopfochytrium polystomum]